MRTIPILLVLSLSSCHGCTGMNTDRDDLSGYPTDLSQADLAAVDQNREPDLTGVVSNGLTVSTLSTGSLTMPVALALDPKGPYLWVADFGNHTVQKLELGSGMLVLTVGKSGMPGFADGGPGVAAFRYPSGVRVDTDGAVYVADSFNNAIRKITFPAGQPTVSTLAGGTRGKLDGSGMAAQFDQPSDLALDALNNVYVADALNCALRQISPAGATKTLYSPGCKAINTIYMARSLALTSDGVYYTSDPADHRILRTTIVAGSGTTAVYAGSERTLGLPGFQDGPAAEARFHTPYGIALDESGNLLVADQDNQRIRRILSGPSPAVETLAGSISGAQDGDALLQARFNAPQGITADPRGVIYVADTGNRAIRVIK